MRGVKAHLVTFSQILTINLNESSQELSDGFIFLPPGERLPNPFHPLAVGAQVAPAGAGGGAEVDDARVAKAKADIQSLEAALSMYYLDNSKYPSSEQGLTALTQQPTDPSIKHWRPGGYLERVSKDPWGNAYLYTFPGTHGKLYDLYTLGADGQPGGDGINADIGNWNLGD